MGVSFRHPASGDRADSQRALAVGAIIVLAIMGRLLAWLALNPPLQSDALSYFTMAQSLAQRGDLVDNFGQHAFYSAGYPLFLAPFFWWFGARIPVAITVNLALSGLSTYLVFRIANALTGKRTTASLAAAIHALWLPAVWNATMLAKENLSTPLVLGVVLCAWSMAHGKRTGRSAASAGLLWGAGLVTGGSSLLIALAPGVALVIAGWVHGAARARAGAALFVAGALLVLGPWLYATDRMIGSPVLTTNAAFNLYLGNNPAADGRFVSIADTPVGPGWQQTRIELGEAGTARMLQGQAREWIAHHPETAARLAVRKLALFWEPNVPDAQDFAASRAIAIVRLGDVVEYGLILLLALSGFCSAAVSMRDRLVLGATIVGFWIIHAAAYVLPRYRDPIMPIVIIMAAIPLSASLSRVLARRETRHAA